MATRREKVVLDLEDNFTAGMARAAASAKMLDAALNDLSGSSVSSARAMRDMNRSDGLPAIGRNASKAGASIDQLSGRVRIFLDLAAMMGPALVPIGGVAIPAVTGLASQLGFAAGAAGTAIIAFQGVGDALKSIKDAQLEPTAENLAEMRKQLEDLSPAAARFAIKSHGLADNLKAVRDSAATGLFPGVNRSFGDLEVILERLEPLMFTVGDAMGSIVESSAESLASGRWEDFFAFIEAEARPTLTELAATTGDFAHGLAEMWMAFEPLNNDFSGWLRDVAAGFDGWASGLSQTEGFAEFMDYIRANGPQVADTMGALGNVLLQVVQAAAPLGGPVLQALEAIADVVSTIADSDLGTPLLAGLAAMSAMNTATTIWGKASQTSAGQFVAGQARAAAGVRSLSGDLKSMRGEYAKVGAVQATMLSGFSNTTAAAQRTRASLTAVGKTAGMVAGIATVTSGVADSMGYASTASLALMGAMVGGAPGAAVGGLIGVTMDVSSASKDASQALRQLQTAMDSASVTQFASSLANAEQQLGKQTDSTIYGFDALGDRAGKLVNMIAPLSNYDNIVGRLTGSTGELEDKTATAEERLGDLRLGASALAAQLGIADSVGSATFEQMDAALVAVRPAMNALGLDVYDVMDAIAQGGFDKLVGDIGAWMAAADSSAGRTDALKSAIDGLDNELLSTADSASAAKAALDSLLSPQMNLAEATDAWNAGLRNIKDSLAENSRTLRGNTDAADQNRAAVRDQVTNLTELMGAQADAGAGTGKLTRTMQEGRRAIMDAGVAAGISRAEMRDYINTLGLTPEMVRTLVDADTTPAERRIEAVQAKLDKYGLTTATGKAALNDVASGKIRTVQGLVDKYGMTKAEAKALLRDQASGALAALQGRLNALDGDIATVTVRTINETINRVSNQVSGFLGGALGRGSADGSTVPDDGGGYRDYLLYGLAPLEEVVGNRYGQAERYRPVLKAINANAPRDVVKGMLADGGTAGRASFAFSGWAAGNNRPTTASAADLIAQLHKSAHGLKGLTAAVAKSEKIIDKERQQRQDLASRRDDIAGRVTDSLRSDIWATSGNAWSGSAADPLSALRADIAKAGEHDKLRKQLTAKGLDGNALEEALSEIDRARLLGGMSRAEVDEFERLYNRRERLTSAAGAAAGVAVMGPELREQTRELRQANKRLDRLERAVKVADKNAKRNSDKNASDVTKGVNGAGTKGKRSQRRDR